MGTPCALVRSLGSISVLATVVTVPASTNAKWNVSSSLAVAGPVKVHDRSTLMRYARSCEASAFAGTRWAGREARPKLGPLKREARSVQSGDRARTRLILLVRFRTASGSPVFTPTIAKLIAGGVRAPA